MTSPSIGDLDALTARAADLAAAFTGWTVDAVAELIGPGAAAALDREQRLPALLVARESSSPVAVLMRLFSLGDEVSAGEVRAVLGDAADAVLEPGAQAGTVRATIDISPVSAAFEQGERDWWLASDLPELSTGEGLADDHVLGSGGASRTLIAATVRRSGEGVLDLGTGSGVQALHASVHAASVVATDVSERALAYARLNAALAGVEWDLRRGSMLEPVAGEQFDLIVSNPPFVIAPADAPQFEYRSAGRAGDRVVAELLASVGEHLAPGGIAQMLANWEIAGDAPSTPASSVASPGSTGDASSTPAWEARVRDMLAASAVPVDAWVIQRDLLDPAHYAETWLRDAGLTRERDAHAFEDAYRAYLEDFEARGVTGIGFGLVLVRRPADGGPTLSRFEELEGPVDSLGAHLRECLDAHDWLASVTDAELLDTAFVPASDVTREEYGRWGSQDPEHILIRQGGGFGRAVRADTALAGLMGASDGELTAGQIAHALAALLDVPARDMVAGLVPAVRELVLTGMLLRA